MTSLAWIATAIFVGIPWAALLLLALHEFRRWLRHRHQEPIEPSPLIREINRWRASSDRTFARQAITPLQGHPRLGIDHPTRRRA
jgi:hypothetical protein